VEDEEVPEPPAAPPPPESDSESDTDPVEALSEKHSEQVVEVLLRMLDWMGVHKNTWSSAAGVWDMLRTQIPDPDDYPVFSAVKAVLVKYMDGRVELVPICVRNCMAFYSCKSPGYSDPEWQTGDDDFCSLCGEDRWLREDRHGKTGINRKVQITPHLPSATSCLASADIRCFVGCSIPVPCSLCTSYPRSTSFMISSSNPTCRSMCVPIPPTLLLEASGDPGDGPRRSRA
jgi:hypothetical protein